MNPESFLALTARNTHPAFLLSEQGTVVAANPSGSAVLGCSHGCTGDGLEFADFVEDPPATFLSHLRSWAAAGLPTNRPIRIRGVAGHKTHYRGEGLRVMSPGPDTSPFVLLHCVPLVTGSPSADSWLVRAPEPVQEPPKRASAPDPSSTRRTVGKMEAMANLAAGIAHDFNNLLTVMKAEVELAMEHQDLPALVVDSLLSTHVAISRAESLVGGLLAFSRHQFLRTAEVDLRSIVDRAMPRVVPLTGETRPVLRRSAVRLPVLVDPEQMETVLLALVLNAVEASGTGSTIRIETRLEALGPQFVKENAGATEGRFAVLEVVDRGSGITPEVQARMFEPFFTTKGRGSGRGLGLAQAFGIVKTLGGYLKVRSTEGSGSAVAVYLPLHQPPATPPD